MGWQLIGFSKRTELAVGERPISRDQIIRLRDVFDIGDDQQDYFAEAYRLA